jgi:hypothetical protein
MRIQNLNEVIEVSIIGDNARNLLLRHSGAGRNPAGLFNKHLACVPRCGSLFSDWIPACAGMTVVHKFCVMNYGKLNSASGTIPTVCDFPV